MPDPNENTDDKQSSVNDDSESKSNDDPSQKSESIEDLVKQQVNEELKAIKKSLDNAYSERDAAANKLAELELKEQEREAQRLKDDGKHKEAFELELKLEQEATAKERARVAALEKRNTELTRDINLKNLMSSFDFKTDSAANMAYHSVLSELIQNESGEWVHKSGASMSDYVNTFMSADDQAFLLKPVVSSGSGSTPSPNGDISKNKSLFDLPQEEVLKRAARGEL
jgi:hypothetical protein